MHGLPSLGEVRAKVEFKTKIPLYEHDYDTSNNPIAIDSKYMEVKGEDMIKVPDV